MARLQAELERSHAASLAKDHELAQTREQVSLLTQERELLLRTTEMYEADKRDLQEEVSCGGRSSRSGGAPAISGVFVV